MAFDVKRLMEEMAAAPLLSPYPPELSRAVVNDVFRRAGQRPLSSSSWQDRETMGGLPRMAEQSGMLAHAMGSTSLREETVAALTPSVSPQDVLGRFFSSIEPLTAEMIRNNAFRQEEFFRKWIAAVGGQVEGEGEEASQKRLETLDYGGTLAAYEKAEQARETEASRREAVLRKAREDAAAAANAGRE